MPDRSALASGQRWLDRAAAAQAGGDLPGAIDHADRAVRTLRRGLGPQDPNLAPAWLALGHLRAARDDARGAARALSRAATLFRPLRRDEDVLDLWLEASVALAHAQIELGRYPAATATLRGALPIARRRRGDASVEAARLWNAKGKLCKYTARFAEGQRAYLRALAVFEATGDDEVVTVLHNLGGLFHAAGDYATAEPWAWRAVERRTATAGPDSLGVAVELAAWAPIVAELDRAPEAAEALTRAIAIFRAADLRYDLAAALHNLAALKEPERNLREAVRLKAALFGTSHPEVAMSEHNLAATVAPDHPEEAAALSAHAHAVFARVLGPSHPHTRAARAQRDALALG